MVWLLDSYGLVVGMHPLHLLAPIIPPMGRGVFHARDRGLVRGSCDLRYVVIHETSDGSRTPYLLVPFDQSTPSIAICRGSDVSQDV
jgi:hypothetical protein